MTGGLPRFSKPCSLEERLIETKEHVEKLDPVFYHDVMKRMESGELTGDLDIDEALGIITAWTGRLYTRTLGHFVAFCREKFGGFRSETPAELLEEFKYSIDMELLEKALVTVMEAAGGKS